MWVEGGGLVELRRRCERIAGLGLISRFGSMNWSYFLYHFFAQLLLMQLVLLGVSLLQKLILVPLLSSGSAMFPAVGFLVEGLSRRIRPEQCSADFSLLSVTLWMLITLCSTFLLHLPSMWERRVQLRRPDRALDHIWYKSLTLPYWHPPHIAFPLIWIPSKILRATATAMVWQRTKLNPATAVTTSAITSIVLADLWNQVFFIQHDVSGGLFVICFLLAVEFLYSVSVARVIPGVERLTFPGLLACSFGATLNLSIWLLNRKDRARSPRRESS